MQKWWNKVKVTAFKPPSLYYNLLLVPPSATGSSDTQYLVCHPFTSITTWTWLGIDFQRVSNCISGIFSQQRGKTSANQAFTVLTSPRVSTRSRQSSVTWCLRRIHIYLIRFRSSEQGVWSATSILQYVKNSYIIFKIWILALSYCNIGSQSMTLIYHRIRRRYL